MPQSLGPLAGIRVLDLGKYIAGPYAANIFGDFGADVIRVERPSGSEDRTVIPVTEEKDAIGATFLNNNRNKRSVVIDITKPAGREIFEKLVKTADVVVINVPPGVLKSLRLDHDSLRIVKSDIILAVATAYGTAGPYKDRPGFDAVGQCLSGAVDLSGPPELPVRAQAAYCDFGTALYLTIGILIALRERDQSGVGQVVEGSLLHTGLSFVSQFLTEQATRNKNRPRTGNRGQTSGPIDIFETRDDRILVFGMGDAQFARAAKLLNHPEWIGDERFTTDEQRGANGAALSEVFSKWCSALTAKEALEKLEDARIPAAPVLKMREVLENEQVLVNAFMETTSYPGVPLDVPVVSLPVRLSHSKRTMGRAPGFGEHTDFVLRELGLSEKQIADLKQSGIAAG
jgi:crotonobetainyl-CoA:carnitine CoA-transferase CaiB-like acyl-CoA transferase